MCTKILYDGGESYEGMKLGGNFIRVIGWLLIKIIALFFISEFMSILINTNIFIIVNSSAVLYHIVWWK